MHIEDIQAEFARIAIARRQAVVELRNRLPELLRPLFDKHPKLESVSWTQYTPYFNDGDTCEFSANVDYLDMVFDGVEHEELGSYAFRHEDRYPPELEAAWRDISALLKSIPEDVLLDLFDDHVRVTLTREGASTEEHDHD